MKYSGNNNKNNSSSSLFCEQVSTVTSLFEKWNDCERTVVMYALLKRLRYPNLKFLQYSIENNLIQNYNQQQQQQHNQQQPQITTISTVIDYNANNSNYLQKLICAYKKLSNFNSNSNNLLNIKNDNDSLLPPLTSGNSGGGVRGGGGGASSSTSTLLLYESDKQLLKNLTTKGILLPPIGANGTTTTPAATTPASSTTASATHKIYTKKEDILNDILGMLPLLKPGNDEAKFIYLSIIPLAVEDTVRQIVSTELVQQIFSYLLIHPAISNEDRRSLSHWLRHLEEHIQSSFTTNSSSNEQSQNFYILNNSTTELTSLSKSSASIASSSSTSLNNCHSNNCNTWQAIAPPSQSILNLNSRYNSIINSNNVATTTIGNNNSNGNNGNDWNISQITDNIICDDLNLMKLNNELTTSSQNNLGFIYDNTQISSNGNNNNHTTNCSNNNKTTNNNNDDHHISFSKNGTEIIDFDINQSCDKCNTQIVGYNSIMLCCEHQQQQAAAAVTAAATSSFLSLPRWSLDSKMNTMKTRRSNSLTTPPTTISSSSSSASSTSSASSSTSSVITVNDNCSSNSSENLSQYAAIQKPRSYSLSIENSRNILVSSGSDTRLDDFHKPQLQQNHPLQQQQHHHQQQQQSLLTTPYNNNNMMMMKFQTYNSGMSNIGQWLKSLRLHKYINLFTNMTYEQMLEITEEYLQSLGVTKGASHKLALCIEKLKDRFYYLMKIEQDFLDNQMTLTMLIEELTNIVLTPMKPIDSNPHNIARKFLHVLELVTITITKNDVTTIQDEECINAVLWILERSIHNDAFVSHTNQLKEYKFKLTKIKMQFTPKIHQQHIKNTNNGNLNKPRWNNKVRKPDGSNMITKGGSIDRINNRKNSHDMINFSLSSLQQQQNSNATTTSNNTNDLELYHNSIPPSITTNLSSTLCQQRQLSPNLFTSVPLTHSGISSASSVSAVSTTSSSCPQYKSSSYPNFTNSLNCQNSANNPYQQQQPPPVPQQQQQQYHQQQMQLHHQQLQQQQQQVPPSTTTTNYRHRHSLSNLIVISANPQQPQHMLFQHGKGIIQFPQQNTLTNVTGITTTTNTTTPTAPDDPPNHMNLLKNRRSSLNKSIIPSNVIGKQSNSNQPQMLSTSTSGAAATASTIIPPASITGILNNENHTTTSSNSSSSSNNNISSNAEKTLAEIIAVSNNNNNTILCNNGNSYINLKSTINCGNNLINTIMNNNDCCHDKNHIIIDTTTTSCQKSFQTTKTPNKISKNNLNDINRSLDQLEFLCLQMTEQAIN